MSQIDPSTGKTIGASATPPNPPAEPIRGNQSQQSSGSDDMGPYKEAFKDMLSDLLKSVPVLKDLADQADKIAKKTEEINKSTTTFSNKVKGMTSDYKYMVSGVDDVLGDVTDSFKKLADYQRELGQHAAKNATSHEHVLEVLEKMQEANEAILKKGLGSPEQLASVKRHRDALNKALDEAKKKTGNLISQDYAIDLLAPVQKATTQMQKLGVEAKKARLSNLGHDIRSAEKGMQALFGFKDRAAKYRGLADVFHELKATKAERRKGQLGNFQAHKEKLLSSPELGLDQYRRADGSLDRKRYLKDAALQAQEHGYTGLAGRAIAQTALDHHEGKTSSMLTRILAQGEGHFGKGVTSVALDALEGAGGAIGGVVAGAGGVLGTLELFKELIDKNQTSKAEINDKLGSSGIYDGMGVGDALHNVRKTLNQGTNSFLGIGYDKNLAIASALSEAGFSNRNLNQPINESNKADSSGVLQGSFGAMQQNVYAFGRVAGLDSSQTMAQTLKLVTQYKQSLVSTEDFFMQITKDSRAAGISTMKYIGLLDEVNSHYERSNKLIMATVDTIRILGVTGRNTVEDISEQMGALTNNGKERGIGQRVYANQLINEDPEARADLARRRSMAVDDAIDNVYKAFSHIDTATGKLTEGISKDKVFGDDTKGGETITRDKIKDLSEKGVSAMMLAVQRQFAGDTPAMQSASAAMKALIRARQRNVKVDYTDANAALETSSLSPDEISQQSESDVLLRKAMRLNRSKEGSSFTGSDFFDEKRFNEMKSNYALQQTLGSAFQTDNPREYFDKIQDSMLQTASAYVKVGKAGMSNVTASTPQVEVDRLKDEMEEIYKMLKPSGLVEGKGDHATLVQKAMTEKESKVMDFLTKNMGDTLLHKTLAGDPALARAMRINNFDAAAAEGTKDAKDMVINTKTLSDVLKEFFESWMKEVYGALDSINKVVSWWAGKQGMNQSAGSLAADPRDNKTKGLEAQQDIAVENKRIEEIKKKGNNLSAEDKKKLHDAEWNRQFEVDYNNALAFANTDKVQKMQAKHDEIYNNNVSDPGSQLRSWGIDPMKYNLLPTSKVITATDDNLGYKVSTIVSNTFNSVDFKHMGEDMDKHFNNPGETPRSAISNTPKKK